MAKPDGRALQGLQAQERFMESVWVPQALNDDDDKKFAVEPTILPEAAHEAEALNALLVARALPLHVLLPTCFSF